jgi:hypothetical protein
MLDAIMETLILYLCGFGLGLATAEFAVRRWRRRGLIP